MAEHLASGSFLTSTSTGVVTHISGLGFTPKLIILRCSINTARNTSQVMVGRSLSAWTPTYAFSHSIESANGALGTRRRVVNDVGDGLNIRVTGGGVAVQARVQLSGNDVQLNYSTASASTYEIHYEVYGGDTFECSIDTVVGSQTAVNVGFQPTLVLAWNAATTNVTGDAQSFSEHGYGFSDGTTTRSNILDVHYSGWYDILSGQMSFGNVSERIEGLAFTATGFSFNSVSFETIEFISMRFVDRSVVVGNMVKEVTGVAGVTQNMPDLGFEPDYIHFFSANREKLDDETVGDGSNRGELTFGYANSSEQKGFSNYKDFDWDSSSISRDNACLPLGNHDNPDSARGTIGSLATNTPTITWNPNNTVSYHIGYYAIGPAPSSGDTITPSDGTVETEAYSPSYSRAIAPVDGTSETVAYSPTYTISGSISPTDGTVETEAYAPAYTQVQAIVPSDGTVETVAYSPTYARSIAPSDGAQETEAYSPSYSIGGAIVPSDGVVETEAYSPTYTLTGIITPIDGIAETIAYSPTYTIAGSISPIDGTVETEAYSPTYSRAISPGDGTVETTAYSPLYSRTISIEDGLVETVAYSPIYAFELPNTISPSDGAVETEAYAPTYSRSIVPVDGAIETEAYSPGYAFVIDVSDGVVETVAYSPTYTRLLSPIDGSVETQGYSPTFILDGSIVPSDGIVETEAYSPTYSIVIAVNDDTFSRTVVVAHQSRTITKSTLSRTIIMATENPFSLAIGDTKPALEDLFYYGPATDDAEKTIIDDIALSDILSVKLRFIKPGDPTIYERDAVAFIGADGTIGARYQWQSADTTTTIPGPIKYNWVITLTDGSVFRPGQNGPGYVYLRRAI